jgi:hypothetical protein
LTLPRDGARRSLAHADHHAMTSFEPSEGHTTPATAPTQDFREIAHSGGKIIFDILVDPDGRTQFSVTVTGSRPVPMSMFIPVGINHLGGIGQPWNPPPHPSCVPVFIASDSEGYFGHECPDCGKYWRSGTLVRVCPYCRGHGEAFQFLTPAHLAYVRHYVRTLFNGVKGTPTRSVEPSDNRHGCGRRWSLCPQTRLLSSWHKPTDAIQVCPLSGG